jgi:hypothetical protein
LRTQYIALCDRLLAEGHLPPLPNQPWECSIITSAFTCPSEMDFDNSVARLKFPVDWLRGKYIVDDRRKNLIWQQFPVQHITRSTFPSVTLTLTHRP